MGMPAAWVNVVMAERFSCAPWDIEEAPLDRYLYYRRLLSIEGEASAAMHGLPSNERSYRED